MGNTEQDNVHEVIAKEISSAWPIRFLGARLAELHRQQEMSLQDLRDAIERLRKVDNNANVDAGEKLK